MWVSPVSSYFPKNLPLSVNVCPGIPSVVYLRHMLRFRHKLDQDELVTKNEWLQLPYLCNF